MKNAGWKALFAAFAVVVIVGVVWMVHKHYDCRQRNAAFAKQIADIERDARQRLRPGVGKPIVVQFFEEHEMHYSFYESGASGNLATSGCAPLGCGTDEAMIGVNLKLDNTDDVVGEPKVVGFYTNCL